MAFSIRCIIHSLQIVASCFNMLRSLAVKGCYAIVDHPWTAMHAMTPASRTFSIEPVSKTVSP